MDFSTPSHLRTCKSGPLHRHVDSGPPTKPILVGSRNYSAMVVLIGIPEFNGFDLYPLKTNVILIGEWVFEMGYTKTDEFEKRGSPGDDAVDPPQGHVICVAPATDWNCRRCVKASTVIAFGRALGIPHVCLRARTNTLPCI